MLMDIAKENKLIQSYRSKNIDLAKVDLQFAKYDLITYSESMQLLDAPTARLYDSRIDKTILLNIPIELANKLDSLRNEGKIGRLAFKPKKHILYDGKFFESIIDEYVEYGKMFSVNNLNNVFVTKMVDSSYENSLWIKVDSKNKAVTFEEILQDNEANNNCIITQVIHMEYTEDESGYYINHLDHEYIYYSSDEFKHRLFDSSQKGNFRQRSKTFKIDLARIPVIDIDNQCFLYSVLLYYFEKKELLLEYFGKII